MSEYTPGLRGESLFGFLFFVYDWTRVIVKGSMEFMSELDAILHEHLVGTYGHGLFFGGS